VSLQREDGSYAGWTVFAGRNGSGKSTLLKAIALAVAGAQNGRTLVTVFPNWVFRGKPEGEAAVQIEVDRNKDKYQGPGNTAFTPYWLALKWIANNSSDTLKSVDEKNIKNVQKAPYQGPWADNPEGWMLIGYGPYRHIGPMTVDIAQKKAVPLLSRLVSLFSEASLVDAISWPKEIHYKSLENKPGQKELLAGLVSLLSDGLLPDGAAVEKVDSDGLWICRGDVSLPLEQLSDGYKDVPFATDLDEQKLVVVGHTTKPSCALGVKQAPTVVDFFHVSQGILLSFFTCDTCFPSVSLIILREYPSKNASLLSGNRPPFRGKVNHIYMVSSAFSAFFAVSIRDTPTPSPPPPPPQTPVPPAAEAPLSTIPPTAHTPPPPPHTDPPPPPPFSTSSPSNP
jgi:energy-coupling factor transporter ATP-binding protein EcfA2